MKKYLTLRRKRDELGVVAIIAALLAVVLLMFAAYAVDIGMQVNRKHQLNDTLDAAAQAGAYNLPGNSLQAKTDALAFALAHDPTETGSLKPNVDFWCVVASKLTSGVYQPDSTQMPSTCYPGTAPYTSGVNYKATGLKTNCSTKLCAIPCVEPASNTGTPKIACNTIRVFQGRAVPFGFAPAGGIDEGHDRERHLRGLQGFVRHDRAQPDGRRDRGRPHEQHGPDRCRQAARRHQGNAAVDDCQPAVRRHGYDRPQWPDHHRPGRFEGL